jgi:hypothetical protein
MNSRQEKGYSVAMVMIFVKYLCSFYDFIHVSFYRMILASQYVLHENDIHRYAANSDGSKKFE